MRHDVKSTQTHTPRTRSTLTPAATDPALHAGTTSRICPVFSSSTDLMALASEELRDETVQSAVPQLSRA
eukprot:17906-Amphidinium_carterae.1